MTDPASNLADLDRLAKSSVWALVIAVLDEQMAKELIPPLVVGTVDEIATATITRSARYRAFEWVRNRMLTEMIAREKQALAE